MCWNFETSSLTFFIVLAVGVSLYNRGLYNDKVLGVFIISYGSMQLFESLMWLGQKENLKILNYFGSYLASIFLHLHPILILLGFYLDKKTYPNIEKTLTFRIFLGLSVLLTLWGIYSSMRTPKSLFITKPDNQCGHLQWRFPTHRHYLIPFVLVVASIILMARPLSFKTISISYFVIGAILSSIFVTCVVSYNSSKGVGTYINNTLNAASISFGSYWCWFVAFFSFILFFVNPYIQPKK
jgi:hypothetical protein